MKHEDILPLLDGVLARLRDSDIHTLSFEADGISLHVERHPQSATAPAASAAAPVAAFVPAPAAGNAVPVKSPIVGTFYAGSSPDAPPYVTVGSRVSRGDTLCILEAMKMMNEIEAERDGVITRILLKNGDLAEFGQTLFEMEAIE